MELKALENRGMLQTASRNNRKVRKRGLLIAELLRNFVNLTVDDVLDLSDLLVAHDVLADLVVDSLLGLVQAVLYGLLDLAEVLLNGALDIEAHGGLLSALTRSKASPEVRSDSPVWAKSECNALMDETCKLGLYVTVEPSVDAIHMPDYAHRNFTAHGLRPSISLHTRGGKKNHPRER